MTTQNTTAAFYSNNAKQFFNDTFYLDMSSLQTKFASLIPKQGKVIDAGCGSGRDALFFKKQGFEVMAFDNCLELVEQARQATDIDVHHSSFLDFDVERESIDGVWACASLLHVSEDELYETFKHLSGMIKGGGKLFCSFKYGEGRLERAGRTFTNMNEENLRTIVSGTYLSVEEMWVTEDQRASVDDKWLCVIMTKDYLKLRGSNE